MSTRAAPMVSASGLGRRFDGLVAVAGLDFEVARGELFGFVGPDGAGKTTTLRMLAGVLRPTAGDAVLNGVSLRDDPEGVKPFTAYMSQRFGVYGDLTVRENIEFYADLYGVPKAERPARLERLYAFSNLGEFEDRLGADLSGGMKQKLSLSCALVHEPEILLLDEPTFGVDPISRRDLWLILHEMVAQGVTVIVSTAYLDEAERCDRVVLLDHGRELAAGTPAELRGRLPGELLSVRTDRPRRARDIARGHAAAQAVALFGDRVHVSFADADRDWPRLRAELERADVRVLDAERTAATLEDVFIYLVERAGRAGG